MLLLPRLLKALALLQSLALLLQSLALAPKLLQARSLATSLLQARAQGRLRQARGLPLERGLQQPRKLLSVRWRQRNPVQLWRGSKRHRASIGRWRFSKRRLLHCASYGSPGRQLTKLAQSRQAQLQVYLV